MLNFLIQLFFRILDWWNATEINLEKGYFHINYRYRFKKYDLWLPYNHLGLPYKAIFKGHTVDFTQQPGIPLYIKPETLGYDQIWELVIDD